MGHPELNKIIPVLSLDDIWRFWMKVEIKSEDDCWEWLAGKFADGYGTFRLRQFGHYKAPRIAYFIKHKIDPIGELVCHICDNPGCVNPNHLVLGSHHFNMLDAWSKGRKCQKGENHASHRLIEEDIEIIRDSDKTVEELSTIYNVGARHIRAIKNYQTWRHLK